MANISKTTKNHDEIREWAEKRGGKPAHVAKTGSSGDIGILRLEFPGAPASDDSTLEEISWEQFFQKFDEGGLSLLYQEETAGGEKSNFNKLVAAGKTAAGAAKESRSRSASTSRPAAAAKKVAATRTAVKKTAVKKTAAKKAVAKKAPPAKKSASKSSRPVAKKKAARTDARSAGPRKPLKKAAARKRR